MGETLKLWEMLPELPTGVRQQLELDGVKGETNRVTHAIEGSS